MEEEKKRTVKGSITAWTKEIKEKQIQGMSFYQAGMLISNEWHNILSTDKNSLEALKEAEAPLNSEVEFEEINNNGYWNFVSGSLKIIKKGDGIRKSFGSRGFSESFEAKRTSLNCATAILSSMIKNEKGQPLNLDNTKGICSLLEEIYPRVLNLINQDIQKTED